MNHRLKQMEIKLCFAMLILMRWKV